MTENVIHYKDYTALVGYSDDDEEFFGNIVGIEPHGVNFGGKTVKELKKHMREAVEGYLEFCAENGIEAKKPCNGRITVRTTPEHHALYVQAAVLSGKRSLNAFIDDTLLARASTIVETHHKA